MDGLIERALDRLFPPSCVLCRAPLEGGAAICRGCREELPWNRNPCPLCAAPLPGGVAGPCGRCRGKPPPWSRARVPLLYAEPVDGLIQGFKFDGRLHLGRLLAALMAEALADGEGGRPELILPVPLHRSRLRERGFNQGLELARPAGRALGIPVAAGLCERLRPTEVQSRLPAKARRANVRGAFALTAPLPARHVAVVDDVLTTGHTAAEIARVLKRGGAETVEIWTLARAGWG